MRGGSAGSGKMSVTAVDGSANGSKMQRRRTIAEKPNYSLNLWSIMKNCVGRDLSKIPMPVSDHYISVSTHESQSVSLMAVNVLQVNFSEPLSMLQRLTEDFEYSICLDNAAKCDQWEQMCYVAAFTISSYSSTTTRTGKPFNPLLGETFECDRMDDLGWRSITEQVSQSPVTIAVTHHPLPTSVWYKLAGSR